MNVKDVMNKEPHAVRMVDRLDRAARLMWEQDCGFAPVVDGADVLVGVLTDRDLCMASYMQGRALAEVPVLAVMSRELTVVRADDALATAMQAMQDTQVHRLPVVDARGVLVGVISSNDLLRLATTRPAVVEAQKVLQMLARIGAPRRASTGGPAEAPIEAVAAAGAEPAAASTSASTAASTAGSTTGSMAPAQPKVAKAAAKPRSRKKKA